MTLLSWLFICVMALQVCQSYVTPGVSNVCKPEFLKVNSHINQRLTSSHNHTIANDNLMTAVRARRMSLVKKMFKERGDGFGDVTINTAAVVAYRLGYFEILDYFTQHYLPKSWLSNVLLAAATCRGLANTVAVFLRNKRNITSLIPSLACAMKRKHAATALAILTHGNVSKDDLAKADGIIRFSVESPNLFIRILRKMLQLGLDANSVTNFGDSLLVSVVRNNASIKVADLFISSGADVNRANQIGETALHWACRNNLTHVVQLLLQKGANVAQPTESRDKSTPLHYAVQFDASTEIVKELLRHGAFLESRTHSLNTPLTLASKSNASLELVRLLIDSGANVNEDDMHYETALVLAVRNKRSDLVKLLIDRGADLNARDSGGSTALTLSTHLKAPIEIVRLLLDGRYNTSAANVNVADMNGFTALTYACYENEVEVVRLLLARGANPNIRDRMYNGSALNFATSVDSPEIIRMLLIHGADPNITDNDGWTPLNRACAQSSEETIHLLLDAGAVVTARTLLIAIGNDRSFEVIKTLIVKGADVNDLEDGNTPLILAVRANRLDVSQLLLKYGADVNAKDELNNTAILIATQYNCSSDLLHLLISNGANVNTQNSNNENALTFASEFNQTENVELLLKSGAIFISRHSEKPDINDQTISKETIVSDSTLQRKPTSPFKIISSVSVAKEKKSILSMLFLMDGFYTPYSTEYPVDVDKYKLALPAALQTDPSSRKCLLEALQFLLDLVNTRSDILPGYELEIHYYHDDISPIFQPQLQSDFVGKQLIKNITTISPIVLGPKMADTSKCQFWEAISRAFHKQQEEAFLSSMRVELCPGKRTVFDSSLVKPVDVNRIAELTILEFLKSDKFGSKWKRIAIVGDTRDFLGQSRLPQYHSLLLNNGLKIATVEIGDEYLSIFKRVKQTHSRIIVFSSYISDCDKCLEIWCSSYYAEMDRDKYIFLLKGIACVTCSIWQTESGNCTVEIQRKQIAMAFFGSQRSNVIGIEATMTNNFAATFIGNILNTWSEPDSALPLPTKQCSKGNWFDLQPLSKLVREVVTEAASDAGFSGSNGGVNFRNSHMGAVVQANFDFKKLDRNIELTPVGSYSWNGDQVEYRVVALIDRLFAADNVSYNLNFTALNVTPRSPILWAPRSGLPPKDLSDILVINSSYHDIAFNILLAIAAFLTAFQVFLAILILHGRLKSRKNRSRSTQNQAIYSDDSNNMFILAGCFFLNISVFGILTGTEYYPQALCYFRPAFCVIGLTTITGSLFAKMLMMPAYAQENRYITRKYREKENLFNEKFHEQQRQLHVTQIEAKTLKLSSLIVLATTVGLLIWLASDPVTLESAIENENEPLFDSDLDSFYFVKIEWCESKSQVYWIAFITVIQCSVLCFAGVIGLRLKQKIKFVRRRWKPEIYRIRIAINNSVTIVVFISLLMVVLPAKPVSLWYLKTLCFSTGLLLHSLTTSAITCSSSLLPLLSSLKKYFYH